PSSPPEDGGRNGSGSLRRCTGPRLSTGRVAGRGAAAGGARPTVCADGGGASSLRRPGAAHRPRHNLAPAIAEPAGRAAATVALVGGGGPDRRSVASCTST